jgi:hypothetical protein
MSSQGANTTTIVTRYRFNQLSLRDSSDYTQMKKERIIYSDPKHKTTTNGSNPTDKSGLAYEKYGSEFRLNFLNGRFKCRTSDCNANAFSGNGVRSGT